MLEIWRCPDPDEKRRRVAALDPATQTWVVSDLQSKWHLQKELLARHGVLEQTTIVRARELWERLSFQLLPETHLLSRELAQTLFWNWIEPMDLPWAKSPRAVPVVLTQMQMWMTIFSDPNHEEIMSQWFSDNQEAYVRWGHWFELCSTIWKRCQERGLLMIDWLPAVLLSKDLSRLRWKKELIFDLGPQISQVEGQLIRELGKHLEVRVIYPEAPWLGLMPNTLRPYEGLVDTSAGQEADWQPRAGERTEFGRFSTQLAEVKDAVASVRRWLDEGVEPQEIALVAPDIEEYWPSLNLYLREEGIPVAKALCAKLGSFLEMARWLASLRTAMRKVSSGDLEVLLFTERHQPPMSFDEFRVLFTNVYDADDLGRARKYFEGHTALDASTALSMREFLGWTLGFWEREWPTERLLALLKVIGVEVPRNMELLPGQWLSYLEGVLARRELTVSPGDESGIWCVSLSSADWIPTTHAIFLNLNESAMRSLENSPVSASEAQKIFTDTGYAVGTNDRQEREFEFLWFMRRDWRHLRLCFSGTDFQGRVLTPSRLWMWSGFVAGRFKEKPESPGVTRWDEIQKLSPERLASERRFEPARARALSTGLRRETDLSINSWGKREGTRISASSLERYWNCTFMFSAERVLKLNDDPTLDLDLDHRTRGSLLHAVLEELGTEPFRASRTDEELQAVVDGARERSGIRIGEERLWPAVRAQHMRLARRFLEFEREWRAKFPRTKTVGREVPFEAYWDLESNTATDRPTPIRLRGRLDRVDQDSRGRYALIDYKASGNNTNWSSWLKSGKVQMALYAYLLERGLGGLPAGEVVAANYYVVKDGDRRKGFHAPDSEAELYAGDEKHRNFLAENEKHELYTELETLISKALGDILDGRLNPEPQDRKECLECTWRVLCRAPHLN